MILMRRRLVALALAATALLSGCTVPGQPLDAGTAASFRGDVVTVADAAEFEAAFLDDLAAAANSGEPLTLRLLHPHVVELAAAEGVVFSEEQLRESADLWRASQNQELGAEVSQASVDIVETAWCLDTLVRSETGIVQLNTLIQEMEAEVVASPRFGPFSFDVFLESLAGVFEDRQTRGDELGPVTFMVFKDVNGFNPLATPEWVERSGS
jgi:hypothetical protein